jgi:hypothetical protein
LWLEFELVARKNEGFCGMSTRFSIRATNGTAFRPASDAALILGGLLLLISP